MVEAALTLIAEERENHRLMCHGITQSLTAKSGAYVTPVGSKEINSNLMKILPTVIAREIATMSAASDMPYDVASRISNEVINPQKEEKDNKDCDKSIRKRKAEQSGIFNQNKKSRTG